MRFAAYDGIRDVRIGSLILKFTEQNADRVQPDGGCRDVLLGHKVAFVRLNEMHEGVAAVEFAPGV